MKIIVLLLFISTQVLSKLPDLDKAYELPQIDVSKELSKDAQTSAKDQPLRYAIGTEIDNISIMAGKNNSGQWDQLPDGSWIWRLLVHAENAQSLAFGLYDFYLPPSATLYFYDSSGDLAKGPFTEKKNKDHKQFWSGPIIGDSITVELRVSDKYKGYVSFSIKNISRGYRSIWQDVELLPKAGQQKFWADPTENDTIKSGSCNVDVVCAEGDEWRDQIRAVARYTISVNGSSFLCTGQMINNVENDGKPLFLTANHCGFNSTTDASINVWWNYESNQCRAPGSGASGTSIPVGNFNDTQSGSTFRASYVPSDFALLELDDIPDSAYEVFYTGWDRRDDISNSAVGIHHPSGHAKRISFENDPTSITGYLSLTADDRSHIRIADWDLGTTEGGSSGSGLWNSDNLLVGQLHGGFAACGNDTDDWYGRLNTSWEGGGAADSRLKDWLDPNDSGLETLQGLGACSAMSITITHNSSDEVIGVVQKFMVNVEGGVPPYKYNWDVNADRQIDGNEVSISTTYAQQFIDNVSVGITDSEGCTGASRKAVVIEAPRVSLLNIGDAVQMCGNDDNFIDPGERWRVPVTLQNSGFQDADNAYAVFIKVGADDNTGIIDQDNFGNTVGSCAAQFIDISSSGTELLFTDADPNDAFAATDEGVAEAILNQPFDLYGQIIDSLYLSSNGYITTDPTESGFDFDNDCPLPTLPNNLASGVSTNARIIPLHDDLITQHIYQQHFEICPRQSELARDLSCEIFMYNDVDLFNTISIEHFNFEAILYPTVNQWVYQYDGTGFNPASSSIGLQNDNASDGISFSCNADNGINTQDAVCVYHRDNQLATGEDDSFFHIETPLIAMGDLQISQQHNGFVEFSVAENASCDAPLAIQMRASVYSAGFNQDDTEVYAGQLGSNGVCTVSTTCAPSSSNDIKATNGLWFNKNRPGNGNDMYFSESGLIYLQYTALPDRSPIWYISNGMNMQNNQAYNELMMISYDGPFLSSTQSVMTIGDSTTTLIDPNNAVQTRTINGQFSADLISSYIFAGKVEEQRTGLWLSSEEMGWGQSVGTQGDVEVLINYIYDDSGQPYWVLGSGTNSAVEDIDMQYFNVFCPHCPSLPIQSSMVGTVRMNYDASNQTSTMENMQIKVNSNTHEGEWDRSNIPLILTTPPLED